MKCCSPTCVLLGISFVTGLCYFGLVSVLCLFSFNFIINGEEREATAESQLAFTLFFFVFRLTVALTCSFVGELSCRFGRKRMILAGFLTYFAAAILVLISLLAKSTSFLYIAGFLLGMLTPIYPLLNAFLADVVDKETLLMTAPRLTSIFGLGLVLCNPILVIFLPMGLEVCSIVFAFIAICGAGVTVLVQDCSPPKDSRKFDSGMIAPWSAPGQIGAEGKYVVGIFCQYLCFQCVWGSWLAVLGNFLLSRMDLTAAQVALSFMVILFFTAITVALLPKCVGVQKTYKCTWFFCILAGLVGLFAANIVVFLIFQILMIVALAGWVSTISIFFSFGTPATGSYYVGAYKTGNGLPYAFGIICGGGLFAASLMSPTLSDALPGFCFLPILTFGIIGLAIHMYTEKLCKEET